MNFEMQKLSDIGRARSTRANSIGNLDQYL